MTRRATMAERERIETILRHEKPDRVPIWPFAAGGFSCVYTGTSVADAYNKTGGSACRTEKDLP